MIQIIVALRQRITSTPASRFLLAGGLAAAVNWITRFPLSILFSFQASVAIAYIFGMVVGFEVYRRWVFLGSSISLRGQILRFVIVNAISATFVVTIAIVFLTWSIELGLPTKWAEAVAHGLAIGIGALLNFPAHKIVTFGTRRPK